jgi:hypothetical protein
MKHQKRIAVSTVNVSVVGNEDDSTYAAVDTSELYITD